MMRFAYGNKQAQEKCSSNSWTAHGREHCWASAFQPEPPVVLANDQRPWSSPTTISMRTTISGDVLQDMPPVPVGNGTCIRVRSQLESVFPKDVAERRHTHQTQSELVFLDVRRTTWPAVWSSGLNKPALQIRNE